MNHTHTHTHTPNLYSNLIWGVSLLTPLASQGMYARCNSGKSGGPDQCSLDVVPSHAPSLQLSHMLPPSSSVQSLEPCYTRRGLGSWVEKGGMGNGVEWKRRVEWGEKRMRSGWEGWSRERREWGVEEKNRVGREEKEEWMRRVEWGEKRMRSRREE